jgi:hypothetical protein
MVDIEAAREFARWHLGYSAWADDIIYAYEHPTEALTKLARDQGDYCDSAATLLERSKVNSDG